MDSKEMKTMRSMAWRRARGELESMLETFWSMEHDNQYITLRDLMREFVKTVEDEDLHS